MLALMLSVSKASMALTEQMSQLEKQKIILVYIYHKGTDVGLPTRPRHQHVKSIIGLEFSG